MGGKGVFFPHLRLSRDGGEGFSGRRLRERDRVAIGLGDGVFVLEVDWTAGGWI
jgi:hypothetical protein